MSDSRTCIRVELPGDGDLPRLQLRGVARVRLLSALRAAAADRLKGQFLIDRDGVPGVGKFPSAEEIIAAARALL
jgi:hypothetical protein